MSRRPTIPLADVRPNRPASSGSPVLANARAITHTRRLVDEARDELGFEDAKAARLCAAMSVAASALVAGFFAGDWNPANLRPIAFACWALGAAALVAGVALLGAASVTKGGRRPPSDAMSLAFHGHAARHPNPGALAESILTASFEEEKELRRLSERLWNLGRVVRRKRMLLRIGLACVATGSLLCAAGPLANGG